MIVGNAILNVNNTVGEEDI